MFNGKQHANRKPETQRFNRKLCLFPHFLRTILFTKATIDINMINEGVALLWFKNVSYQFKYEACQMSDLLASIKLFLCCVVDSKTVVCVILFQSFKSRH